MGVVGIIFSPPFLIGMVVGIIGQRLYCVARAKWMDQHHPLGRPRHVTGLSRMWVGTLVVVMIQGYVLLQAQQTHDATVALTDRFGRCTTDLLDGITARSDINGGRDDLSEEQRALSLAIDNETAKLIKAALNPPPELWTVSGDARRVWSIALQEDYDRVTAPLRARSAQIDTEVAALRAARSQTSLPSPRCDD